MNLAQQMKQLAEKAKQGSRKIALLSGKEKKFILKEIARSLARKSKQIQKENEKDLKYARLHGLSQAMQDRLLLNASRIQAMADAVSEVADLPDVVGDVLESWKRPNGLRLEKVRVPLGVVLVIYESRPNVTSECASLCFKSGNAVILKGGKEAFHSNKIISDVYREVLGRHGLPKDAVSFVPTTERAAVGQLLQLDKWIDLAIPRGGEGLIRHVTKISKIPLVKHDKGLCHIYVDKDADLKMAQNIVVNAKCQRPSVCNALETLLVHERIAKKLFPPLFNELIEKGCEVRASEKVRRQVHDKRLRAASSRDWDAEYLELILSVQTVKNLEEALTHIEILFVFFLDLFGFPRQ